MYKYVGIKLIEAEPAYKVVGACQQVQIVPAKEVRKKDLPKCAQEGYKIRYSDGYESWSPKAAFEEAYRDVGKMSFPMAMAMLQKGAHVARHYWDTVEGDGDWATRKYLYMEKGFPDGVKASAHLAEACGVTEGETIYHEPYIHSRTIDSNSFTMWIPTMRDFFATDWYVVSWGGYPIKD